MTQTKTHAGSRERKPEALQRKANPTTGKGPARGAPLAYRATPEQRRAPAGSQLVAEMPRGPQPGMGAFARQTGVMASPRPMAGQKQETAPGMPQGGQRATPMSAPASAAVMPAPQTSAAAGPSMMPGGPAALSGAPVAGPTAAKQIMQPGARAPTIGATAAPVSGRKKHVMVPSPPEFHPHALAGRAPRRTMQSTAQAFPAQSPAARAGMMPGAAAPVKARAGAAIAGPQVSARASAVLERAEPRVGFDYPNVILRGTTAHFSVYYDPDSLGVNGPVIADGVLATCENDYDVVSGYFGGLNVGPMNVIIAAGISGAYHYGCGGTDIYCDGDTVANPDIDLTRMLVVAEEVEVFSNAQGIGWDCSASNGEGLSRVLAIDAYPAELCKVLCFTTGPAWLDSSRPDWVTNNEATDTDPIANGCSVLFLNYLHSELGYSWTEIVAAGAGTLAQTYTNLTGRIDAFEKFTELLQNQYPAGTPSGLQTDNPYPFLNHLDLFVVGTDGAIWSNWWDVNAGAWSGWFSLGGFVAEQSPVTSVAQYSDHLDIFVVGTDGAIWSNWWDLNVNNAQWNGWYSLGGFVPEQSTVSAVSRYPGHLDLFVVGYDGAIWSNWWDANANNGQWNGWFSLGGFVPQNSTVTAVSQNANHLDLFVVGTDGAIWSNWWDASTGWASWFSLGGFVPERSMVTAVSRYPGHLDLFVVGYDGAIWSNWWDASTGWASWFSLGGFVPQNSVVTALSRYRDHLDLFVVGTDGGIYSNWWDGSTGWASWFRIGDATDIFPQNSVVTAVSQEANHLDIFTVGFDGQIYTTWWDLGANNAAWNAWYGVGGFVAQESAVNSIARFAVAEASA